MDPKYLEVRLKELGLYSSFRHRLEYRRLSSILPQEGGIDAASGGIFRGKRWLIFGIARDIYFISAHPVSGVSVLTIPLEKIRLVKAKKGLFFGSLRLLVDEEIETLGNMQKKGVDLFTSFIPLQEG